jgi:predicted transcriptional regulator
MNTSKIAKGLVLLCLLTAIGLGTIGAHAAGVGQKLENVTLKDAEKKDTTLPGFGEKVISVTYADMQTADDNDPVADAIKANKYDEVKYKGFGVANLKDSWAPNAIIRVVIKKKMKKYDTVILTDEDHFIPKAWGLGDCNDVSVFMVIGKDQQVKFIKKGKVAGKEIDQVIRIIEAEMNK